jgi:opacity protein-like surface antigen
MRIVRTIVAALLASFACVTTAWADGDHIELREWGVRAGGGINSSSLIQYYAVHPYVGLALWDPASRWFDQYGIRALWMLEPWAAYVNDDHGKHQTDSFEIGLNALFLRMVFGDWMLRPFVEAGEGVVYTDLRKQDLGTRVQFTSTVGGGLEYALRPDMAIGFQVRLRHMSNAGMASSNPGINTVYGLIGLTFR